MGSHCRDDHCGDCVLREHPCSTLFQRRLGRNWLAKDSTKPEVIVLRFGAILICGVGKQRSLKDTFHFGGCPTLRQNPCGWLGKGFPKVA